MRLLVFGETGQVARELIRRAPADVHITTLNRDRADLMDPDACAAAVRESEVDAIINAAAWTAVDLAETEEAAATVVNGDAPTVMAGAAVERGVPFLHISTDYVFDGAGNTPFAPDHTTDPIGAYGRSKLKGEEGIRSFGGAHLILRTSWVFSAHGSNFVKTMLRLGADRDSLTVVADQIGVPPRRCYRRRPNQRRTRDGGRSPRRHASLCGCPGYQLGGFRPRNFKETGLSCCVSNVSSRDYPSPVRRPLNSRLDCSSFSAAFSIERPDWRAGLSDIFKDLSIS